MKKLFVLCTIISFVGTISGCQSNAKTEELENINFFALDTFIDINITDGNTSALEEVKDYVLYMYTVWSATDENNEIYILNQEKTLELSPESIDVLHLAYALSEQTKGAFDITVHPIVEAWGFTTDEHKVPTQSEIDALLPYVNYQNVTIDDSVVTLYDETEITLGGIAKGYLADQTAAILQAHDIHSGVINLGGNIHAMGKKDDGSHWKIGIDSPDGKAVLGIVDVTDKAVVTSGGYERYFVEDNNLYWHIMNPQSGYPAFNGILSTTIICDSGIYADVLSTSLFVMGVDGAIKFYQEHQDFDAVLVTGDTIYVTEGIADDIFITENYQDLLLQVVK